MVRSVPRKLALIYGAAKLLWRGSPPCTNVLKHNSEYGVSLQVIQLIRLSNLQIQCTLDIVESLVSHKLSAIVRFSAIQIGFITVSASIEPPLE